QILLHMQPGTSADEARTRTARVLRSYFTRLRTFSDDALLSTAASSFAAAFDSRSGYYTPRDWNESMNNLASQMVGIGASLRLENGYVEVVKIISGGPASSDGQLKEGDRIVAVGQGTEDLTDVVGMPLSNVVDR